MGSLARRISYMAYLMLRRAARCKYRPTPEKQSRLLVWPPIESKDELADVIDWVTWYIPENSGLTVLLIGAPQIAADAQSQGKIAQGNIRLLTQPTGESFETVLIRKNTLQNCLDALVRFNAKLECIDKDFFGVHESLAFERIYRKHGTDLLRELRGQIEQASEANFDAVYSKYGGCRRAFILATGPSIQNIFTINISEDDLVIACNSLVRNQKALAYARPAVLTFADPVFHFGRSAYAKQFRTHLVRAVASSECVCVVPPERGLLLALHHPDLISRLVLMPTGRSFNLPTPRNRAVRAADNIMTLYMLPIASALAREVYIFGADGRAKTDSYFWKYDQGSQYDDLLKSAIDTHPSFFRDRDYDAYFRNHCAAIKAIISEGEKRGMKYYSASFSTVPALRQRVIAGDIPSVGT